MFKFKMLLFVDGENIWLLESSSLKRDYKDSNDSNII